MRTGFSIIIKNEYEKRQKEANDKLQQRREEVFSRVPRVEDIDREIRLAGLKHNRMLLLDGANTESVLAGLKTDIERLKREREILLETNGFERGYLNPAFRCERCRDTGFPTDGGESGTDICTCYRQQMINLIHTQSNLKLTGSESFESFNENYYSDTADENRYGIRKSPRRQITGIKENCLQFIEGFRSPETRNLLFCGPTGVGKTFMADCIAVELMNRGLTVLYQSAPVLFNTITEYRLRTSKDEAYENSVYRNIIEVELLIIDDLGTESPSAARYAELLTILDTRSANNLIRPCKTVISTNIDIKKLYEYYDERVASRIIGNFDIYRFAGDDIRKLKLGMA